METTMDSNRIPKSISVNLKNGVTHRRKKILDYPVVDGDTKTVGYWLNDDTVEICPLDSVWSVLIHFDEEPL